MHEHVFSINVVIGDINEQQAIELNPSLKGAVHNRAITIGKIKAEKATQTIKESYEKQLSSITDPADIDKRFEARKKISEERLNRYRNYTAGCIGVLVFLVPIIWYLLSYEIELFDVDCKENGCSNFFLIAKNISITVTTLFLLSPIFIFLSYCNRNARIERHTSQECHVTPQPPRRRQYSDADGTSG